MSIITSPLLLGADGVTQYQISRSLRFNAPDSSFLSRTPGSAGNRKTWTWAGWVKRSNPSPSNSETLFTGLGGGVSTTCEVTASGQIEIYTYSGGYVYQKLSTALYRDFSAWYHFQLVYDTGNATAEDRILFYVNGVRITSWSTNTNPSQNYEGVVNQSGTPVFMGGGVGGGGYYFTGYLAECFFIDGQALTPSSFTETDATTGQLIPKAYTGGSYGTNGFKLNFSDNSTVAALGTDTSGNGNTWTVNNLSVTAGSGNDSLVDTPTSYGTDTGVGGEVRGNYATWNPLAILGTASTINNGNLTFPGGTDSGNTSTIGMASGKWYWEITFESSRSGQLYMGITNVTGSSSDRGAGMCSIRDTGALFNINGATTNGSGATAFTNNDVVSFAYDADSKRLFIGKNNTWLNSANPAAGTNATYTNVQGSVLYAAISENLSSTTNVNFGQRAFAYTAPSGFKALCDTNLPTPVIAKPNTVMDVKLYTGNGSTQTISGLGFSPDLVWIKDRVNGGYNHLNFDTVRGVNKYLSTSSTAAEGGTAGQYVTSFNSDGFTVGPEAGVNENNNAHVAWTWDAGTSTVTNTAGSISSQVRANASAGFSVGTYTGNSTAGATVGHGLGVAPGMIIVKNRTASAGYLNWGVYHSSLGNTKVVYLNTTAAEFADITEWNNTSPTSTVFSLGFSAGSGHNISSQNYVAYCFAPVSGYSSFGSYTGNGSADGPFVYTGFRPRWVMIKGNMTSDWMLVDTSRAEYNAISKKLYANLSLAENGGFGETDTTNLVDHLSNGFKLRSTNTYTNQSSTSYIYAAFAENPFQYARAR